jgi:hypothetical protein
MKNLKLILIVIATLYATFQTSAQEKVFTCINEQGNELFKFEAYSVWPFRDGMAMYKTVVLNEAGTQYLWRIGFINESGRIVIKPQFDAKYVVYYGFTDGVSWVRYPDTDKFVLINKRGEPISEKSYEKVGSFNEGMGVVYEGYNQGWVDTTGKEIIPCIYTGDPWFYQGLACVCPAESQIESYGYIDKKGEIIIPFKFKQPGYSGFENGEARAVVNGKTCLINLKGEIVFTPTLTNNMDQFNCGLASAYTTPNRGGFGFFNRNNNWIIQPIYDRVSSFENGRAIVEKGGLVGVIDTLGNFVIPMTYDKIYGDCGDHGLFHTQKDGHTFFFDCNGKQFTSIEVNNIEGSNGTGKHPYRNMQDKMGYLNSDGSIFIDAVYDRTERFREGKAWVY